VKPTAKRRETILPVTDSIYHIHRFMEPFCTPEAANNVGDEGSYTKGQHTAVNLE